MFRFFQRHADLAVLFLRLGIAVVFVYHGYHKLWGSGVQRSIDHFALLGMPMPAFASYAIAGVEFFGGIMVGLGLLTRQASLALALTLLISLAVVHRHSTFGEMEQVVQLLLLSLAALFSGSGSWSLENLVRKHGD